MVPWGGVFLCWDVQPVQWPPVTLMPRQVWVLEHAPDVLSSVFRGEEGIDHDGPRLNGLFNKEHDDEIGRNLIGFHGGES